MSDVHLFELGEHKYQVRPINVFDQLELAEKLTPILFIAGQQEDKTKLKQGFKHLFIGSTSNLKKEERKELFNMVLPTVFRQEGKTWRPIYQKGDLVFSDIKLGDLILILYEVLEANALLDFFSESGLMLINEMGKAQN